MRGVLTGGYVINGVAYVSMQCTWRIHRLIQGSCLLICSSTSIKLDAMLPSIVVWLWWSYDYEL